MNDATGPATRVEDLSPIDPEIQEFLTSMRAGWARFPALESVTPAEARRIAERVREPFRQGGPEMSETRDLSIPTRHGPMRARLYDPGLGAAAPLLIYSHGGGFTLFSIDTHDRLMREYAHAARIKVLGLDYYLSPEHKFPTAIDQIEDTVDWIRTADLGIDPDRVAMGGDSAGGNMTMAVAIRLRNKGKDTALKGLLFNYAGFASDCSDEAEALHGGPGSVMDRAEITYYFRNYTRTAEDMVDPEIYLLKADIRNLPPTFFVIPDRDIICADSFAMVARLRDAGNDVRFEIYRGAIHSFLEAMATSHLARKAIADGAAFLRTILKN
ncbi:acetylesterase [Metarhizobium album]|uniref:Acetylesterase n=1 Tax=Metarhizobium album TaxID=2182425 RepID=A0A2U2DFX9_9HYPH|nr:alpha/beta hydrolase fold domain-containing protein [Rhizobium album]PWE52202.1 acetylesterase [Rhizobium album]